MSNQTKVTYWEARAVRQQAFGKTDIGRKLLANGGFYEAFGRLEKPFLKAVRASA